ncbi:MAG: TRAP transporter small permease [Elusimicrobiota bacterium]|nr:TRAP transporter small permease [Elusimicrobiota bacterium]
MLKLIEKVWSYFEEICLIVFFAFMVIMNFANVLSRYALNMSISFADELVICIFVWMTMFGTAAAYKRGAHFAMGLLSEYAKPKYMAWVSLFSTLCSMLLIILLFYYSFDMINSQIISGQATAALRMPVYYQGLAIPIGCVLIAIRVIQFGINDFKKYFYFSANAQSGR